MKHVYADVERWATICVVDLTWSTLEGCVIQDVAVGRRFRGQGAARDLMQQVLDDADAEGVALYLSIVPDPPGQNNLTYDQLRDWYMRLGFESFADADGNAFRRPPRGHQTRAVGGSDDARAAASAQLH